MEVRNPFFSIIVCTYNRAHLIRNALDSLLKQKEKSYEVIIVDDGSEDGTLSVVKPYFCEFDNWRYVYQTHKGLSKARNAGIYASVGEYITFLDSDDEYEENHLLIRKNFIIDNAFPDLVYGGAKVIGDPYVPDKNNPQKLVHLNDCVIGGTFFIKREVILALGGFEERDFADDSAFYDKVCEKGYKICKIEEPTYIYHREFSDSICNQIRMESRNEFFRR